MRNIQFGLSCPEENEREVTISKYNQGTCLSHMPRFTLFEDPIPRMRLFPENAFQEIQSHCLPDVRHITHKCSSHKAIHP